jgi:Holliday junction resolvase RusA-like endonuclease
MVFSGIEDTILESLPDGVTSGVSFTAIGKPPVQPRQCIAYRGRRWPVVYDPAAREKRAFKEVLKRELLSLGYDLASPILAPGQLVRVEATFYLVNFDFTKKDLDNLLKYILDVSNGIIYHNDSAVAYVVMQKKRLPLPQEEAHPGQRLQISFGRHFEEA